jgi:hypothetical protein
MKLSTLIPVLADALGAPLQSVGVLAGSLRKQGLISTGGRGLGAPEMTPADVTNLLLATMCGPPAKDAHVAVTRLREADACIDLPPESQPALDIPFLVGPHTLGEALEGIFLSYAAEGELRQAEHGLPITNMTFTVTFPHLVCYRATLRIDAGGDDWTIRYHRDHPAFDEAPQATRKENARTLPRGYGDLIFTATITSSTFYALAGALETSARQEAARQLASVLRGEARPGSDL